MMVSILIISNLILLTTGYLLAQKVRELDKDLNDTFANLEEDIEYVQSDNELIQKQLDGQLKWLEAIDENHKGQVELNKYICDRL